MTPERTRAVRLGVAGQNLFDIAFAVELRAARGLEEGGAVEFEMLSGMATDLQAVVRCEVGHLLLYMPVVNPDEFDVAISYLVHRLEKNAAPENFMSGVFDIASDPRHSGLRLGEVPLDRARSGDPGPADRRRGPGAVGAAARPPGDHGGGPVGQGCLDALLSKIPTTIFFLL